MSQGGAPNSLRILEFGGYAHYSEWPKVADAVIEAEYSIRLVLALLIVRDVRDNDLDRDCIAPVLTCLRYFHILIFILEAS